MPSQVTITADSGPDVASVATVLTNVRVFELNLAGKATVHIVSDAGDQYYDLLAVTTLTCTISAGVATIVVS